MDTWLSQVDAMDYVISVANTTIHGAGGLGKPTFAQSNVLIGDGLIQRFMMIATGTNQSVPDSKQKKHHGTTPLTRQINGRPTC